MDWEIVRDLERAFDETCITYYPFFSRPKSVDEVAYQEEVVNTLKKSLESKNVSGVLRDPTAKLCIPAVATSFVLRPSWNW
jgi:hypothetical protein